MSLDRKTMRKIIWLIVLAGLVLVISLNILSVISGISWVLGILYPFFLGGCMGTGKGTVGKKLAKDMGLPLLDVDKMVTDKLKMSSGDIYDRFGEAYYRAMETFILVGLLKETERSIIIIGSGLALMPQNAPYLKCLGRVYCLQANQDVIIERIEKSKKHDFRETPSKEEMVSLLKEMEQEGADIAKIAVTPQEETDVLHLLTASYEASLAMSIPVITISMAVGFPDGLLHEEACRVL